MSPDHKKLIADNLGDPSEYFVDPLGGVARVVRHSDGKVIAEIDGNTVYAFVARPDPSAPPVTGTLDYKARPGEFGRRGNR